MSSMTCLSGRAPEAGRQPTTQDPTHCLAGTCGQNATPTIPASNSRAGATMVAGSRDERLKTLLDWAETQERNASAITPESSGVVGAQRVAQHVYAHPLMSMKTGTELHSIVDRREGARGVETICPADRSSVGAGQPSLDETDLDTSQRHFGLRVRSLVRRSHALCHSCSRTWTAASSLASKTLRRVLGAISAASFPASTRKAHSYKAVTASLGARMLMVAWLCAHMRRRRQLFKRPSLSGRSGASSSWTRSTRVVSAHANERYSRGGMGPRGG